jgi:hypothetical protein
MTTTAVSTATASSDTLRPPRWNHQREMSAGTKSLQSKQMQCMQSASLVSLESDLALLDILRGPYREVVLGVESEGDNKENVGLGRRAEEMSPGKRMAEKWLSERRSEGYLRRERGVMRTGSALEMRGGL